MIFQRPLQMGFHQILQRAVDGKRQIGAFAGYHALLGGEGRDVDKRAGGLAGQLTLIVAFNAAAAVAVKIDIAKGMAQQVVLRIKATGQGVNLQPVIGQVSHQLGNLRRNATGEQSKGLVRFQNAQ